jgi:hypothetical protein
MNNPIDSFVICPKCKREWQKTSEQGVSVEWHDECVVCKFTPQGKGSNDGTKEELDLVASESMKRRTGQHVCI